MATEFLCTTECGEVCAEKRKGWPHFKERNKQMPWIPWRSVIVAWWPVAVNQIPRILTIDIGSLKGLFGCSCICLIHTCWNRLECIKTKVYSNPCGLRYIYVHPNKAIHIFDSIHMCWRRLKCISIKFYTNSLQYLWFEIVWEIHVRPRKGAIINYTRQCFYLLWDLTPTW